MARVNAGKRGIWWDDGKSKIYCARAPEKGMEARLLNLTVAMVKEKGFSIVLSSVDTGKHVKTSRHYTGRAEDISDVHVYGQRPFPATMANPYAIQMVEWFIQHGAKPGSERAPYDAILFGPVGGHYNKTKVDHSDHAHASIYSAKPQPGDPLPEELIVLGADQPDDGDLFLNACECK